MEGLSRAFIDTNPKPYCNDTSLYKAREAAAALRWLGVSWVLTD